MLGGRRKKSGRQCKLPDPARVLVRKSSSKGEGCAKFEEACTHLALFYYMYLSHHLILSHREHMISLIS